MTLVLETLVALLGGALLGRSRHLRGAWTGIAVVTVGVAGVLLLDNGIRLVASMPGAISRDASMPAAVIEEQPEIAGAAVTNTAPYLDWARTQIMAGPRPATFWLIRGTALGGPFERQWATYKLTPARLSDRAGSARWLLFEGIDPASVHYDRAAFLPPVGFAPGYAIAERRGAG